jgi:hypothetical protein
MESMKHQVYDTANGFIVEMTSGKNRFYVHGENDTCLIQAQGERDLYMRWFEFTNGGGKSRECQTPGWENNHLHQPSELVFIKTFRQLGWNLLCIRTIIGSKANITPTVVNVDDHIEVLKYYDVGSEFYVTRTWLIVHPHKQSMVQVRLNVQDIAGTLRGKWCLMSTGWFNQKIIRPYIGFEPNFNLEMTLQHAPDAALAHSIHADSETRPSQPFHAIYYSTYVDLRDDRLEPEIVELLGKLQVPRDEYKVSKEVFIQDVLQKFKGQVKYQMGQFWYYPKIKNPYPIWSMIRADDDSCERFHVEHSEGLSFPRRRTLQEARDELVDRIERVLHM